MIGIRSMMAALAASVLCSFSANMAVSQVNTVKYSSYLPAGHWVVTEGMLPWVADVEKATAGRVRIDLLPKMVGTPDKQFDIVLDGLADLALIVTGYSPGRFDTVAMGELPLLGDHPPTMSPLFERTFRKHFAQANEFKGVQVLSIFTISPGYIFTSKRNIKAMDEMKGLKLRSSSATANRALTLMGATPVLKPANEAYELISGGIIDGSVMFYETVKSMHTLEVLKYGLIIPGGLYNAVLAIVINDEKWKSISAADQRAIMAVSGEAQASRFGRAYHAADEDGLVSIKARNYELLEMSPAFSAEMKKALSPIEGEWVEKAKKKGIADPAAVLAEFRAEAARLSPKK